ncbi:MAG: hypothetical protein PF450_04355 [Bacteroidales bacterium]|jgi:hypothetical protein|nr:hypothetical protein [Bacteroidales bacterium]
MEFLSVIVVIGMFSFVRSLIRNKPSTSYQPKVKAEQDDDLFCTTLGETRLGIGTLFILDEIIDGGGRDSSKGKQEVTQVQEESFMEEDCFCDDDFEFFD